MVDFAKLNAEWRAAMTPEQRERADRIEAEMALIKATSRPITAEFERLGWKTAPGGLAAIKSGKRVERERHVESRYTREISIQIEPRDGGAREVIQFCGAVTGYEAFELSTDLCGQIVGAPTGDRWYICAGTPERYDACSVATSDVVAYLREMRPDLVGSPSPSL
ncbi:hypothetical protein [Bosea sp. RAC05]|uniref:hypothetical protein n=1 Tax=Bosea sp. RAC05 TaxID=1842539 RepID=UPI00083D5254|nr:hypothetical protein [Bosea sp. RAC05]AOG03319.1 hypothetical protein BSY19_4851 [Bosea sp. RAC05]